MNKLENRESDNLMIYFDEEKYQELERKIKAAAMADNEDSIEDLKYLKNYVLNCCQYVYKVTEEQMETKLARGILKGEELRQRVELFDRMRHTAHEQAIASTRALNRMAEMYGLGKIYTGDEKDRAEIGNFCGEFCSWLFENRYS